VFYQHSLVDEPDSREPPNRHMNELFNQIHRMQTLEIVLPVQPSGSLFPLPELNRPAPCLEVLKISYPTGDDYYTLPLMFGGHTPRLFHLSLYALEPWPFFTCKSLTSLKLTDQSGTDGDKFLDFLDGSPELVEISLDCVHIDEEYTTIRFTRLPKLASLELTMCHSPSILTHLWLPEATSIIIDDTWAYAYSNTGTGVEGNLVNYLPDDCDKLHSLKALTSARLSKTHSRMSLKLEGSGGPTTISEGYHTERHFPLAPSGIWQACLSATSRTPLFSALRKLSLEWESDATNWGDRATMSWGHYQEVFVAMPCLQEITLKIPGITDPLWALGELTEEEELEGVLICSQLHSLSLAPSSSMLEELRWVGVLEEVLRWRRQRGFPITSLRLTIRGIDRTAFHNRVAQIQEHLLGLIELTEVEVLEIPY
jgi:hypothetical protein